MYTITTKEYAELLNVCFDTRQPLFVMGGFGIGKSAIPRQVFAQRAKKMNRIFIEWADASINSKLECLHTPEKYFVFADLRTSQMDTTSLQGIPNMLKTEFLENIPYSWAIYFTTPKAGGAIFFDELNLAAPIVQSITYSAIWDRTISDRRLADDVYVFAAGNRMVDQAHTFDMPAPLKDRFAEVEVSVSTDEWIEWAIHNDVNPHLISFIKWKPTNLYNVSAAKDQKPATPRGVCRASKLIKGIDIYNNEDKIHMLVSISCGESFATEFQAYMVCYKSIEWNVLFANPSKAKNLPSDQQYAISAELAEKFKKNPTDLKLLELIFNIQENLREDFAVFSMRMMKSVDGKNFGKGIQQLDVGRRLAKCYGSVLIDINL